MLTAEIHTIERVWPELVSVFSVPHSDADYRGLVALLDALVDQVGEDEAHPLATFMEVLGVLIERYEDEHVPELVLFSQ